MKAKFKEKAISVFCCNCHKETIGIRNAEGITKIQCRHCRAITVSQVKGRRHVQLDIYAPQGRELIDDDDDV